MSKTTSGKYGEEIASSFLRKKGYRILETNFHSRYGEIDIVAIKDSCLVYVEVKTRWSQSFGLPEEAIQQRKINSIKTTASYYRQLRQGLPEEERIDVVAIEMKKDSPERIELITNVSQF